MQAHYLVRFDDICPGMNFDVWKEVESILDSAAIRPMLAVVPDNQDPLLEAGPRDPEFWSKVRGWQASGWTIGLHGYQHRYVTSKSGIIGRNRYSEFAGLSRPEQIGKLRAAMEIFRHERVRPDVWIAPAHSFDETTVDVLHHLGIRCISDGYALNPWMDERGILWAPQQMARFRPMPTGTWTICHHINGWTDRDIARFRSDIRRYAFRITSLDEVRERFHLRRANLADRALELSIRAARKVGSIGRAA